MVVGLASQTEDHTAARTEAGPTDQHTLPRPNDDPQARALLRRTRDQMAVVTVGALETKQLLGQLSDDRRLEGGGGVHEKLRTLGGPRAVENATGRGGVSRAVPNWNGRIF